jgi:hypothetical protein
VPDMLISSLYAGRKARNRAPVEPAQGVTIEVNTWPPLCDVDGKPAESSVPGWQPSELSRREANLLLRGMRRYARIDKLHDVCADAGPTLADAPPEARYALWHGLEAACRDALAAVEVQGLDPKDAQVCLSGTAFGWHSHRYDQIRLVSGAPADMKCEGRNYVGV